jgi:signal transduction histidine kinase
MPAPRVDVAAAGVLTLTGLAEAVLGLTVEPSPWYVVAAVPVATLPVAWRSRRPVVALLVVLAAMLGQTDLGSDIAGGFSEPLALLLTLYSVGSAVRLRESAAAAALALVAMSAVVALGPGARLGNLVYVWTLVLAGWLAGRGVRLATERSGLLAERRAIQERSRIARELHDVVSHNVSAIVVQAAAERRGLATDAPGAKALEQIEEHGRQTLTELRRLLGLLRVNDSAPGGPPLDPQPGLADVPRLVDASGVAATFRTEGRPVPVGQGLGLAIYRVVQEGLTNVRKHSSGRTAAVAIRWCGKERVEVEVVDHGGRHHDGTVPGTGYGLRAMSERVAAFGGSVSTEHTDDGFRLHVVLPIEEHA